MRRGGLALALALTACGCGYRFVERASALPTDGQRVFAPTFKNDTSEAGLEVLVTDAFRAELADAHVDGPEGSPVLAVGVVKALGGGPGQAFTRENGQVASLASYHVDLGACVRLTRGTKTLAATCVSGSAPYAPGADPLAGESARRVALNRLAQQLMQQAFERLSSAF